MGMSREMHIFGAGILLLAVFLFLGYAITLKAYTEMKAFCETKNYTGIYGNVLAETDFDCKDFKG